MKKIEIKLAKEEVKYLSDFTKKGKKKAVECKRAYILLSLHLGLS